MSDYSRLPGYDAWKLQGPPEPSRIECQGCGSTVDPDESLVCCVCRFECCVNCTPDGFRGELMFTVNGCEKHYEELAVRALEKR